ncbi:MAG: S46 family peptidase [Deltaproteobacteria bacterium]|nr:S46 family peptidase [Deltaproteobacteria bacterium]
MTRRLGWATLALLLVTTPAFADEGMWTFDGFPGQRVEAAYGFTPDAAWLDHVRLSSAQVGGGCSGSFVSADGLVLTNHHCVHGCVQQLSTKQRDLVEHGFNAKTRAQELRCPGFDVTRLEAITDVTEKVLAATAGKQGEAFQKARAAVVAELEAACAASEAVRCDVVDLYRGGRYHLYRYHRYFDVRLAFAPELQAAFFGGDPDNFNFPRFDLDFSLVRVYEDGQPAKVQDHLQSSPAGPEAGDLVFVSGRPGSTRRQLTVAQLAYERDVRLPEVLMRLSEVRGRLYGLAQRGPEQARIAKGTRFSVENAYKAFRGRREALVDTAFFAKKAMEEDALQEKVAADPKLKAQVGDAWGEIARAVATERDLRFALEYQEPGRAHGSRLFAIAWDLVRMADELPKANAERLPEYADARLPVRKAKLMSNAPVYPELEEALLAFALENMRRELGADHPFVRAALGAETPEGLAARVVKGSSLGKVAVREALLKGGKAAVSASKDPMIAWVRTLEPWGREVRKRYEAEVESVVTRAAERIAAARFAIYGTEQYPDATGTLRLSYGAVEGFPYLGQPVPPFTDFAGLYARATGKPPFDLAPSLARAKAKLPLDQRLNLVTTNDIIGGNSGSPLIDKEGRLVGLVFDGNIYSLGGDYGFDPRVNRTVAVHVGAILAALRTAYGAGHLADEMSPP